ncbi:MAG: DUF4115 domain-containing protein [Rickettsiales bacterium]|nr:DUF4115 domain-containing protein [Rickettsiales bacterium]
MAEILKDIGTYFRQIRESIGLDIDTVARELKIRRAYIVGLEQGDFSSLPDREIYVTGMIRGYATFLKNHAYDVDIDPEALVNSYRVVSDDITPAGDFHFPTMETDASKPRFIMVLISVAFVIGFYAYWSNRLEVNDFLNQQIEQLSDQYAGSVSIQIKEKSPEPADDPVRNQEKQEDNTSFVQEPKANQKDVLDIEKYLHLLKEKAQKEAANQQQAVTDQQPPQHANQVRPNQPSQNMQPRQAQQQVANPQPSQRALQPTRPPAPDQNVSGISQQDSGQNQASPTKKNDLTSLRPKVDPVKPKVDPRAAATEASRSNPQAARAPSQSAQQKKAKIPKIVLMAREDTWVRISDSSGSLIVEKVMKSGDAYFLPEKNNLVISAGNADAIEVFIDGDEHSFLGTLNDVSRTN